MPLRTGSPAEGDDFFDRELELATLWRTLEKNHIVLSAPRRMGKTSVLKRLCKDAEARGLFAVYLDVSHRASALELVAAVSEAVPERSLSAHFVRLGTKASAWLDRVGRVRLDAGELGGLELETRQAAAPSWQEAISLLQARLSHRPVLIVLDEFSVFISRLLESRPEEARQLLSALRAWRQTDRAACRFVLSGSIGLNRLLERYRLSTETNDCDDYRLPAFQPAAAIEMVCTLAAREGWPISSADATALCERVGWLSPYYVVTVLEEAIRAAMVRLNAVAPCGQGLTAGDVAAAFQGLLNTRSKFNYWYARLADHFPASDLPWVRAALAKVSARAQGLRLSTLAAMPGAPSDVEGAVLLLEEHGYIVQDGPRVCFLSPLLRTYWKHHHGQ